MQDFRKLDVWQKSYALSLDVYQMTQAYPEDDRFGLVSQMRRAAISIPASIAEGCGQVKDNEMARFLVLAIGSASELDCYLVLSRDLGYVFPEAYLLRQDKVEEIKRMLTSLILKIRTTKANNG